MLNHKGEVAECTGDNIFLVRKGRLLTPPATPASSKASPATPSSNLARRWASSVREVSLTQYDVYVADECFLTGTAAEVIPVVKIDGRVIGDGRPGPITRELMDRFHKLARS